MKEELDRLSLDANGAKNALDGVTRTMVNIEFAAAFRLVVSVYVRACGLVAAV